MNPSRSHNSSSRKLSYPQRLQKDLLEVLSHDFVSPSALVSVSIPQDSIGGLSLSLCMRQGPYKYGHFPFHIHIPDGYPFRQCEVYSTLPIWHPNICLQSGKVMLPFDWSPVLSLVSIVIAVQMIMLEPSIESPLNLEALSYCNNDGALFEEFVRKTLNGCSINGIVLPPLLDIECPFCKNIFSDESTPLKRKKSLDKSFDNGGSNNMHETPNTMMNEMIDSDSYNAKNVNDCEFEGQKMCDNGDDDADNVDLLQHFKRMKYDV